MKLNNDTNAENIGSSPNIANAMLGAVDFRQHDLFGKKVISSIGFDEQEIIRDILHLHSKGNYIDCDPTFSIGNFYKKGLPKPKYRFDKFPQVKGVVEATSNNLPLENESCNVIMYDPPFLLGAGERKEGTSDIIGDRFTRLKDWDDLVNVYSSSLKEFYRLLKPNGIVIFKCQDVVNGGKNHFSHCLVMNEAVRIGYYPKDLFLLLAKNRINDGREQQHARKYHSYYWVLEKSKCKIEYLGSLNCT